MMNVNIINNQHHEFDEDFISQIKEILEKGLNKIKSFVKSKVKPKSDFYKELDCEFDQISYMLEDLGFHEECRYFLSIKDMVLYVVNKNSNNSDFGYCDFAVDLLDFFISLFKRNLEFYREGVSADDESFRLHRDSYKKEYRNYRRIFYQEIYKPSGRFTEDELYEVLKGWKCD
jgi:hypothetical protein